MTNTKIILMSAGGVVGAAASFVAGYFTGKSMERKRLLGEAQVLDIQDQQARQPQHHHPS